MNRLQIGIIIVVLLAIIFGSTIVRLYTDWLWFDDLGYTSIFSKMIWARISLGLSLGALFFVIVYTNLLIARRLAPPPTRRYAGIEEELRARIGAIAEKGLGLLLFGGSLFVAFLVGVEAATHWDEWFKFANATSFGVADPQFGIDIGFYVFRLPFWNYLYGWLFFTLFAATVATAILHYADEGIDFFGNVPRFAPGVKAHLAILLALLFFLKAAGYKLMMFGLVTSPGEIFYGAGYTDIAARLPGLWILLFVAAIGGAAVLANIYRPGIWYAAGAVAGLIVVSFVVGAIYPAVLEQFIVKPNEFQKQRRYITRGIEYTRRAYRVDNIASRPFDYSRELAPEAISRNRAAIQNVRLWDYEPLKRAYRQLQELQQYYDFHDVDIDRYTIDGTYRQVMLSARELPGPPQAAQTWVNKYLRYTHGYGYAMSPVNEVNPEGMPVFFASDIPTVTRGGIELEVPQIYFGELTNDYVLVNTKRKEFDYPVGGADEETVYTAESGPVIGSLLRKLFFAIRFGDVNILLSEDLTASSRVLFRRNISERAQTIFPFLEFDSDPYLVTVDGKLYWFHDAYTSTNKYPYSEPVTFGFQATAARVNYIRNSVKLVTDAYTGKVQAFAFDPDDPIIRTYSKVFPGVFKPADEMPEDFRAHVRYPEDLFRIQALVYSRYHMTNPSTFYSGTDLWRLPEVASGNGAGERQLEPYYIITRLPESSIDEYVVIALLVRPEKHNMVAWMAAKCDPADYGKLIVYEFPRGELVFGPRQIMARTNQDTEISQQLTLWDQLGSNVVRGNLLAIPIENSILYIEPLYLESTTTQIPEFKRAIVALGNSIAMEPTLAEALAAVTGVSGLPAVAEAAEPTEAAPAPERRPTEAAPPPERPAAAPPEVAELTRRARQQFSRAEEAQRSGDWAEYGRQIDALKKTLQELEQQSRE
ncbi:MAG: UPF0182 family protein [Armatimonadetes bacterium]|nr:UPF0182 family protein [Armatimonadota bacterium]